MDRIHEITDKYEKNGVESLTPEEIQYVEDAFMKSYYSDNAYLILYDYCVKKNDFDKMANICDAYFKNNHERMCLNEFHFFVDEMGGVEDNLPKLESLNYPFVYELLGSYYFSIDKKKALQYYDIGAKQGSLACSRSLYEFYTGHDFFTKKKTGNLDLEKAFYYANLTLGSRRDYCILDVNMLFEQLEESNTLPETVKEKCINFVMDSPNLLFHRGLYFFRKYMSNNDEKDFERFLSYCNLSIDKGNYDAAIYLAKMYYDDCYKIVKEDYRKALSYCDKACKLGRDLRLFDISYKCIKKIIDAGDMSALDSCSLEFLAFGGEVFDKSQEYKLAEICREKYNTISSFYELGFKYDKNGDYKSAFDCYKKAAEHGNIGALLRLGIMYQRGKGVDYNFKMAKNYYERCAEKGNHSGMFFSLTNKYVNGEKINYREYFSLAENGGFHEGDEYFKEIKMLLDRGEQVISVESIMQLISEQSFELNDSSDNNQVFGRKIELLVERLNSMQDNTLINLKSTKDSFCSACRDFYKISNLRKIVAVCKKILSSIDLNQSKEDIFMQIYIKLSKMISYDFDCIKEFSNFPLISSNLMVLLYKKGVCYGFSESLSFLLNIVGIRSNVLTSNVNKDGECHAYIQVDLNGKWYYCDLTSDSTLMKLGFLMSCLKSKKDFLGQLSEINKIYHNDSIAMPVELIHEANENYPKVQRLFWKNRFKLFKNDLRASLEQFIEPAGIKEDGGMSR